LKAQQALQSKTDSLLLQPLSGSVRSPRVEKLVGKRYRFDKNHKGMKWAIFEFEDTVWKISFQDRYGRHFLEGNYSGWTEIEDGEHQVAVSGRWTTEDILEILVCDFRTPFITHYKFQFDRNHVLCEVVDNVSSDERIRPAFVGRSDPA